MIFLFIDIVKVLIFIFLLCAFIKSRIKHLLINHSSYFSLLFLNLLNIGEVPDNFNVSQTEYKSTFWKTQPKFFPKGQKQFNSTRNFLASGNNSESRIPSLEKFDSVTTHKI